MRMKSSKKLFSDRKDKRKYMRTMLVFVLLFVSPLHSAPVNAFEHQGQVSLWGVYNDNIDGQMGFRYIPEVTWSGSISDALTIDALLSLDIHTHTTFDSFKEVGDNFDVDLYRAWGRLSGDRYEVRLGLQRINFGPARILRSLKWFDQLDPRDPLNLTDGVYALLGRYYFLNNSNIWIWGLYGNDDLKGLETFKTDGDRVEYGFRYEFPVPKGEMAFTYHNRRVDKHWWSRIQPDILMGGVENRYAIDGSFDIGIGLWFEAAFSELKKDSSHSLWTRHLTIGADYTFDIGPGVHILGEHYLRSTGSGIRELETDSRISAISVDFSTSVLDTITLIAYYDWQKDELYPNLSWQRTYDDWLINVTAFHNSCDTESVYSGTGIICTILYNY